MSVAETGVARSFSPLWKAGLVAAALSALGNGILYAICYVTGIIPWSMLSPGRGVSLTPKLVLSVSVGGSIAGTLIYALLERTSTNPVRTFRHAAVIILALSFGAPFLMGMFTPILAVALSLMHVVVAAATVWALTVWAYSQRRTFLR